jgi:lipopolysaccharide biosynthesis regulator YciM
VAEDWPAAETWLERIVESDSNDFDAYHALARLYRRQGSIGRAIRMHQNLLLRSDLGADDRAEALLELARDFDAGGFSQRAIASYEEFLGLRPRHAEALERLVRLHRRERDHVRALALVRRLRRRDRARPRGGRCPRGGGAARSGAGAP